MTRSLLIVMILALFGSLVGAAPAIAQGEPGVRAGITTTGYGEASAAAESVSMEFVIVDEQAFYGGPPQQAPVEATPGAMARETVAPIVDALEASGAVESVEVVVPMVSLLYAQAPLARIDVTVANPDLAGMTSVVTEVSRAAAGERLLVGYVGARFETSDCATLERGAREAALAEAQTRAGIQAELLGVGLGDVVASVDVDATTGVANLYGAQPTSASNCDPMGSATSGGDFGSGGSLPRFDPTSNSGEVEVYRQVQVTFAIAASEATPAA